MSEFIRYEKQCVVNLEMVTSIYLLAKDNKIYFCFNGMDHEDTNDVVWEMKSKSEFNRIISLLEIKSL